MSPPANLRCGIVGAGRTRNGLGPFLATHLEAAGAEVIGVSGRDAAGAERAAAALADRLGHPVFAHDSLDNLLAAGLDALVIAAPVAAHLQALRDTLAAGVPVLCEKPLVTPAQHPHLADLRAGFRRRKLLLKENCQWPEVLPAWHELFPTAADRPIEHFAMGLSPSQTDPAAMLLDSISHPLSVLQELLPVGATTGLDELRFGDRVGGKDGLVTSFRLSGPFAPVPCRVELRHHPEQPRPAWLEIDGQRMDRVIDAAGYRISFVAGERKVATGDPTAALVYRFVRDVREANHERTRIESDRIRDRSRLCRDIVAGLDQHLASG